MHAEPTAHGDPRVPGRLWAKIDYDPGGCWSWTGARWGHKKTYGAAWYEGTTWRAHRLIYHLLVRPVGKDEHAHHTCRNRLCCNPAHIEALPREEHWGHGHRDKTHCPHGHEYTPENTRRTTFTRLDGTEGYRRHCIACRGGRPSTDY